MSFYSIGILFTLGFQFVASKDVADTWLNGLIMTILALLFPVFWGMVLAQQITKETS